MVIDEGTPNSLLQNDIQRNVDQFVASFNFEP
jgi:hypothetical protein